MDTNGATRSKNGCFSRCLSCPANSILPLVISHSSPLEGFRFSLIGPGNVGCSLASWLVASGAQLLQVVGRPDSKAASDLTRELGGHAGRLQSLHRDDVDLLLFAVPDDQLRNIAGDLGGIKVCSIALHTAGSLGASALDPMRHSASVGSFHPLQAFPHCQPDPTSARGTFFALDGDPEAMELGEQLATLWGGHSARVAERDRDLYHLAARLAAGGVTTLLSVAAEMVQRLGLPHQVVAGYLSLAEGALKSASQADHPGLAITGPLARGETATILRQLREVAERAPELEGIVSTLDLETLRQLDLQEGSSDARRTLLEALLARRKKTS